MTAVELNARKAEIVRAIMSVNDEVVLNRVFCAVSNLTSNRRPCRYTEEEIVASMEEAMKQIEDGRYISHEQMVRKVKNLPH